ncbi:helix-loop-helix dna-binding domain-containing [Trichoderma arundinaceum]|uniref:Helix-loop-helix dna-binding domain-containing n=1 Tax=Trichoderma arundinaceum TaxID=490622 RepID=A0A395P048_TRIAR|nr:helix-loop-helix dna-binding domain-containing [Trichoderma arundinaceum]
MEQALDYNSLSSRRLVNLPERQLSSSNSAITPPSTVQRNPSTWTSPTQPSTMDMFNFTTASSSSAIPSYAPAANAGSSNADNSSSGLGDMTFSQLASQYSSRNPLQSVLSQGKEAHEAKRIKVESPHSALDSIDSWLQFDEEADKFGSFEIDFSKQYNPANQPRPATNMTPGLGSGLYANPTAPFREEDFLDDSAFDHSLSEDDDLFDTMNMNDQLSKIETLPSTEPQSSRSLYSSPSLGWEKPQQGIHPSAVNMSEEIPRRMGSDAWDTAMTQGSNYTLTAEERRRLLEIAMGPSRMSAFVSPNRFNMGYGATMQPSLSQEFNFGFGPKQGLSHVGMFQRNNSADTTASGISQPNRDLKHKHPKHDTPPKTVPAKRPSTLSETSSLSKEKAKSADRMAHNDVERKYRTNLKDKITELRNAVPALQQVAEGEPESAQGIAKVSKGTVLTKATEYIHQLEQRNKDILSEHKQLMRRLQAFEALLNNSMRVDIMPSHSMALFDPRGFC